MIDIYITGSIHVHVGLLLTIPFRVTQGDACPAYDTNGQVQAIGRLGQVSRLRCFLRYRANSEVTRIIWFHGNTSVLDQQSSEGTKRIVRSTANEKQLITGSFNIKNRFHDMELYTSVKINEGPYTCRSFYDDGYRLDGMANLYLPSKNQLSVVCERPYAELGGISRLRCSLLHAGPDMFVTGVHWASGINKELVYVQSTQTPGWSDQRGKFAGRNISGFFGHANMSHALLIQNSGFADEGIYECSFHINDHTHCKGNLHLSLFVKPNISGEIQRLRDGKTYRGSDCKHFSEITQVQVSDKESFMCKVSGCKPGPRIEWSFNGIQYVHLERTHKHAFAGVHIISSRRQIDLMPGEGISVLRCEVTIPSTAKNHLIRKDICLRLMRKNTSANWNVIIWVVSLTLLMMLVVLPYFVKVMCHEPWKGEKTQSKKYMKVPLQGTINGLLVHDLRNNQQMSDI